MYCLINYLQIIYAKKERNKKQREIERKKSAEIFIEPKGEALRHISLGAAWGCAERKNWTRELPVNVSSEINRKYLINSIGGGGWKKKKHNNKFANGN